MDTLLELIALPILKRAVKGVAHMRTQYKGILLPLFGASFLFLGLYAHPQERHASPKAANEVIVIVRRVYGELEYELGSDKFYKKGDLNYALAELKLKCGADCQVIAILEDSAQLSDISDVGIMAINAGFKDIRTYVCWPKTGRMAEILFGPVKKFSKNP